MPLERHFAEALIRTMIDTGWRASLPEGELPNPLDITFAGQNTSRRLIIHARRITPQSRSGPEPSHHNRPVGEMHTQMIFDGDRRGAGVRNKLRFAEGAETVLFGFLPIDDGYVIAAYNPERHRTYAYSKSLQVKRKTIEQALKTGFAFHLRANGETVVVFHVTEVTEYLENAHGLHNLTPLVASEAWEDEAAPSIVRRLLDPTLDPSDLPELMPQERRRALSEANRYIRSRDFTQAIKSVYDRCAICGFQYDYVLDAAHIVPVAKGGTDTYDNGLGLCPNCHRMFDNGLVLVDESGRISINPHYVEELERIGRAGSLETLRATLREYLWLPDDEKYRPSPDNLRRIFRARR